MGYAYAKYRRPDGDEVVLPGDTLTRGHYERKGFTYVGPSDTVPGLEPANPGQDGPAALAASANLDAAAVVKQAAEVAAKKMSGSWTEADAAGEAADTRLGMAERGSFPTSELDSPETLRASAPKVGAAPAPPAPARAAPGSPGAPGAATDGARDLSALGDGQQTVAHAGSPGTFEGPTPALKSDLDRATADPSGPWPEGQYVRVNSRDYTWNGSAWVTATVTAPTA
jgi:hypothetical protein